MSFDLARALRRIKPQRLTDTVQQHRPADLPLAQAPIAAGAELFLDTCVYIDMLQGRTPASVDNLLEARIFNHSTVCLAELTHLFGRLDPADAGTKHVQREIRRTIEDIPSHTRHPQSRRSRRCRCGSFGRTIACTGRVDGLHLRSRTSSALGVGERCKLAATLTQIK